MSPPLQLGAVKSDYDGTENTAVVPHCRRAWEPQFVGASGTKIRYPPFLDKGIELCIELLCSQ